MHAREPALRVHRYEPAVEEDARAAGALCGYQGEGGAWVVKHRVDEHLEVGQLKRLGFRLVEVAKSGRDDEIEFLRFFLFFFLQTVRKMIEPEDGARSRRRCARGG